MDHQVLLVLIVNNAFHTVNIQSSCCTSPESTFRIMLSPSVNIVFCISATIISANHSHSECSLNTLSTSCNTCFIPPSRAPITMGTIVILYPGLLSLNSNASCQYFATFSFLLAAIFVCCRHAISQIQIFFFSLSSNTKSGLLDVVVLLY